MVQSVADSMETEIHSHEQLDIHPDDPAATAWIVDQQEQEDREEEQRAAQQSRGGQPTQDVLPCHHIKHGVGGEPSLSICVDVQFGDAGVCGGVGGGERPARAHVCARISPLGRMLYGTVRLFLHADATPFAAMMSLGAMAARIVKEMSAKKWRSILDELHRLPTIPPYHATIAGE